MLWIDKFDTCIKFFSDISFKYCTLYCHFSLIFVTLHVHVFLFYKKKCYGIYCYQVPQGQICMNGIFFQNGIKKIFLKG